MERKTKEFVCDWCGKEEVYDVAQGIYVKCDNCLSEFIYKHQSLELANNDSYKFQKLIHKNIDHLKTIRSYVLDVIFGVKTDGDKETILKHLDKIAEMLELEKIHLNKSVSEIENNL